MEDIGVPEYRISERRRRKSFAEGAKEHPKEH
jgi:hypothetical protein